jgi:hypothetical protein
MSEQETIFANKFNKFKNLRDKFESQFLIIAFDISIEDLLEKIKHQIELIKLVRDTYKRQYLLNKIYKLKEYVENMNSQERNKISSVFFIDKELLVHEILIEKRWLDNLYNFDTDNYVFKHGEFFDLNFLKDFLLNTQYTHVIHMNNNKLSHYYTSKNKKKLYFNIEKKDIDIMDYIKNNIKNQFCVVHGISGSLKSLKSTDLILIFNKHLNHEEINEQIKSYDKKKYSATLNFWLANLTNDKTSHRICFGKDIEKNIGNKLLKTLFCTSIFYDKVKVKVPLELQIFEVNIIDPDVKDSDCVGVKLHDLYGGAIGITYY